MFTLGSFEREYLPGGRFCRKLQLAQRYAEHGTGRNDDGALDQVLEFADVSRP
jgi:hypothetical protein